MKTYLYPIALIASALPLAAGCASAKSKGEEQFVKITSAPVEKILFNQVHGQVVSRVQPLSSLALGDSCLFRYREEFLSDEGKPVRDMEQDTRKAFLVTRLVHGCGELDQSFIRVFDFDVASFKSTKPLIDAFLRGEYEGSENSSLNALLRSGTLPTSIIRKDPSAFSFMFATPTGFGEAVVSLDVSKGKPKLVSFGEWQ